MGGSKNSCKTRVLLVKEMVRLMLIVQMDMVEKPWPTTWSVCVQLYICQISASC